MRRALLLSVVVMLLAGFAASSAIASTSNYSGWSLPAWLGNSINPTNYTVDLDDTEILVSSNSEDSDFRVRNIRCSSTTQLSSYVDYDGGWTNVWKTVWTDASDGTCFRYQAGAYGLGGTTISGTFKY